MGLAGPLGGGGDWQDYACCFHSPCVGIKTAEHGERALRGISDERQRTGAGEQRPTMSQIATVLSAELHTREGVRTVTNCIQWQSIAIHIP